MILDTAVPALVASSGEVFSSSTRTTVHHSETAIHHEEGDDTFTLSASRTQVCHQERTQCSPLVRGGFFGAAIFGGCGFGFAMFGMPLLGAIFFALAIMALFMALALMMSAHRHGGCAVAEGNGTHSGASRGTNNNTVIINNSSTTINNTIQIQGGSTQPPAKIPEFSITPYGDHGEERTLFPENARPEGFSDTNITHVRFTPDPTHEEPNPQEQTLAIPEEGLVVGNIKIFRDGSFQYNGGAPTLQRNRITVLNNTRPVANVTMIGHN